VAGNPRIDDLRRRLAAEPGSRLFAQLAEELRKAGELAEAVAVCREGLSKHAGYPSARMTLGRALMDGGELQEARGEFLAVLQGAPQNILAGRHLGECLERLGESGAAVARYRTTLLLAPGDDQLTEKIRSLEGGGRTASAPGPRGPGIGASGAAVAASAGAAGAPGAEPGAARSDGAPEPEPVAIPLVAAEEVFELESPLNAPGVGRSEEPDAGPGARSAAPARPQPQVAEQATTSAAVHAEPAEPNGGVAPVAGLGDPGDVEGGTAGGGEGAAEPAFDLDFDSIGVREAPRTSPKTLPFEAGLEEMAARPSDPGPGEDVAEAEVAQGPLASTTLAELYSSQGLTEKAIEVYRELVEREPENAQAKERLVELEGAGASPEGEELPAPDPSLARRRVVERTIRRLEGLLAALGGGRP
jgi:tetratricopeptide (TPR) repeat protein